MQKIVIIGTLHGEYTPKKELEEILNFYSPNQIFVEIYQGDINKNYLEKYPQEMIFALNWARSKKVELSGFDSEIDIFKGGFSASKNQKIIDQQKPVLNKFNWKDFNKKEIFNKINSLAEKKFIDSAANFIREEEMLNNIKKKIIPDGVVLILTGCGHLDFFEKKIKKADFPLR